MAEREDILKALRATSSRTSPPDTLTVRPRLKAEWDMFIERLEELAGHFLALEGPALGASLLRRLDDLKLPAKTAFVDDDAARVLGMESTADVWSADVGITLTDGAVAETGSVILEAGPNRNRLASLAPPVHVALVYEDQLVATLENAIEQGFARTAVIITGPSRTADIEGVLVRGVHGPKDLVIARLQRRDAPGRS